MDSDGQPGESHAVDLPDGAIVVRGGHKTPAQLLARARKDYPRLNAYGLSAFAGWTPTITLAEVIEASELAYPEVQTSTVGRIRAAGFRIERTFKWPHCTIDLGEDPTENTAARLAEQFDPPVPRPGLRGQS